jgi:copper chaperone NosL
MVIAEHPGPKGQVFVEGRDEPVWFPSVRDAIAFTMLPEATASVVGAYVHDMGRARDYADPPDDAWVEAKAAVYVLDSVEEGGMGLPEAVPFAEISAARAFAAAHGGRVVGFAEITPDWIFAAPEDLAAGGS